MRERLHKRFPLRARQVFDWENRRATFILRTPGNVANIVAEPVLCTVCGAKNPAGVQFCESCGVELARAAPVTTEPEIDKLLEELVEIAPGSAPGERESLDIDKEIVDELLDSLLIEEELEDHFDCPLCGTRLPLDAKSCTKCGASFAEVPAAPAAAPRAPDAVEAEGTPSVSVTEEDVSKLRLRSGKLIDFVVLGTIVALIGVFLVFEMYSWAAISANPVSLGIFGGIAIGGMAAGFVLFQISTSAIAQGDRLVKTGRYDDALYHYDRAIRMGSKPASAWTSKGVALKRLGRLDEALRCHNIALKLDPKMEIAWCNKGDIYFRAGQLEKAIECYDKAIKIRPKYAIAWNNKGAVLARQGRFEEARACHDEAVRLKPKYVAAWLNRGEVLARLGLRDEAQLCLDRARALGA